MGEGRHGCLLIRGGYIIVVLEVKACYLASACLKLRWTTRIYIEAGTYKYIDKALKVSHLHSARLAKGEIYPALVMSVEEIPVHMDL
jgi:hypothetical protein